MMRFTSQTSSRHMELLLQPDRLLVIAGEARHEWTYAIPAKKADRSKRKNVADGDQAMFAPRTGTADSP